MHMHAPQFRRVHVGFPRKLYIERGHHKRGTAHYLSSCDLLEQIWIDSKEVYCLSTINRAQYSVEVPETDRSVCRQSAPGAIDVPATVTDYVGYQDTLHLNPYLLWLTVFAIMPKRQTGMLSFRIFRSWPT